MKVVGDVIVKVITPLPLVPPPISAMLQAPATIIVHVSYSDLDRSFDEVALTIRSFRPLGNGASWDYQSDRLFWARPRAIPVQRNVHGIVCWQIFTEPKIEHNIA